MKMLKKRYAAGACAIAMVAALSVPGVAFADKTSAEVQAEADAALAQLETLQSEQEEAEAAYGKALAEQEEAEGKCVKAQERIDAASEEIAGFQERLSYRANAMYRMGNSTVLDMLLGATSFEEFVNNWNFLNSMNENDAELVAQTKELRAEVDEQKQEYEEQSAVAEQKAIEAEEAVQSIEESVAATQATYDSLSAEAAELLQKEREAEERRKAEEERKRLEEEAAARAAAEAARQQEQQQQQDDDSGDDGSDDSGSDDGGNYNGDSVPADDGTVVGRASSWVGKANYVWGACSPGAFDCSGFVSYCLTGQYSRLGTTYTFLGWSQVSDPQPGDVCVNAGHCGIYIGGGQMIHAASPGQGVCTGAVQGGMIYVRYGG